ncbi:RNASEH1 [Bugula neritina]|uniref:Ribonuclease H1 n=1 Tax=Bugula neritina TaxID=10212 RepID=A0A7J7KM55_BUGNE|nr:RNASEH1 [Bugula neritina]
MQFYAVKKGRVPGVYNSWSECQEQISKFSGAAFKKFASEELAWDFVNGGSNSVQAAEQDTKWSSTSKQMLADLSTTLTKSVVMLDKQLNSIPNNLRNNKAVLAGFNETKADVIMCKNTVSSLLKLLGYDDSHSSSPSKRKGDDVTHDTAKKAKVQDSTDVSIPVVYTDGACFNNGKSNAQAGIGVWWGPNDKRNLSRRLPGRQTNNRAEIQAACEAVEQAKELGYTRLEIRTDSQFMISSMTQWIYGWKKRDWQLSGGGGPVKNMEDFKRLDGLCSDVKITWTHVKGHSGIEGNEQADSLANAGARKPM